MTFDPTGLTTRTKPLRSDAELEEMKLLGLIDADGNPRAIPEGGSPTRSAHSVTRRQISNGGVLNEAFDYDKPASFSRGLRLDLRSGTTFLYISGTASVGDNDESLYRNDLRAQCWRTFRNITELLKAEGANWQDIVRTSCYLRDIERDYDDFNEVRTQFFHSQGLNPLPASTGIQARLCREDLLVEIEAIAIVESGKPA